MVETTPSSELNGGWIQQDFKLPQMIVKVLHQTELNCLQAL